MKITSEEMNAVKALLQEFDAITDEKKLLQQRCRDIDYRDKAIQSALYKPVGRHVYDKDHCVKIGDRHFVLSDSRSCEYTVDIQVFDSLDIADEVADDT